MCVVLKRLGPDSQILLGMSLISGASRVLDLVLSKRRLKIVLYLL